MLINFNNCAKKEKELLQGEFQSKLNNFDGNYLKAVISFDNKFIQIRTFRFEWIFKEEWGFLFTLKQLINKIAENLFSK